MVNLQKKIWQEIQERSRRKSQVINSTFAIKKFLKQIDKLPLLDLVPLRKTSILLIK